MGYPPGPAVFVPGQRANSADMNDWLQNLPWGLVDEAVIVNNSSNFTTLADVSGLSVTFTAVSGRVYRVEADVHVASNAGGDRIQVTIADGANAQQIGRYTTIQTNGHSEGLLFAVDVEPGAGSITYKVRCERTSGGGNCFVFAGAGNPSAIRVSDVGPSS